MFVTTLPDIADEMVFLFYSENQEVICVIDGQLVQRFVMDEQMSLLKTPGDAWNQIDLTSDMSGKTCVLTFSSPLSVRYRTLYDIHFVENIDVNHLRFNALWFHGTVDLFVFLLFWIAVVSAFIWRNRSRQQYYQSLARLYLIVFLWLFAELNGFDLFFARPILSYLIANFLIRLLPLALIGLAKHSSNDLAHPHLIYTLEAFAMVNVIVPWVLQFTYGVSLVETESFHAFVMALVTVVLFLIVLKKACAYRTLPSAEYPCLALGILLLGRMIDRRL